MFVVVPVKFDTRVGVNIAGIDYRINSIWIEFLRVKSLCGAHYTHYQNIENCISITYSFKISIRH